MAHDVFISYPHQDKAIADAACAKLEDANIRCWIAPRDIAPGAEWAASIVEAIDQCQVMVLIFCANANGSRQIHREVQQAFDGEKPVIPFRIEDVEPQKTLRYYMGSVHWLDALTPPLEAHLGDLVNSAKRLLGAERNAPISQQPAASRIKVDASMVVGASNGGFQPGAGKTEWFKDLAVGPEMVVVPSGSFLMGSPDAEEGRTT
jgi:hypothetical protein